ncbi:pyruvate kinase [Desulfosarcina alkanivorans]|uniref:Pyruvate kinase n=1 Tax=Desulfosarcina alkanivorans TaxID=571177 RepID=A0A5K7YNR6_9BACT|nr:pyruvate kinase [Desulfosarcina alkanivorans]BBO70846.1 pyruvate kinase [Desulfosarcina alkanivorans]
MTIRTKIVATIGPASNSPEMLHKLVSAGMNVARLNFSHGNYEAHSEAIRHIRSISRVLNRPVGILLDLQGPKIRVGKLVNGEPVRLKRNARFSITSSPVSGTAEMVSTTYRNLPSDVHSGDTILLDDGLIRLQVESKTRDTVTCKVINGGMLKENKGINLPGVKVSAPSLTEKDVRDVNFGIKNGVDFFALSFVRTADDLATIKSIMKKQGVAIPVIAKIEKPEAVANLDAILDIADGIMVARGDLGVEMQPELVPIIQKQTIFATVRKNKPVITATQMLESMTVNPIPTRAEASDVANAIFDGTDAVMLSGETASGRYPVKAVRMMDKIAQAAEGSPFLKVNVLHDSDPVDPVTHAVARNAVNILQEVDARCIIAFSVSGSTSKQISKQRPSKPVYAFTSRMDTYNRLSLLWGITPMFIADIENAARLVESSERLLMGKNCVRQDDLVVLVIGMGLKSGSTNIIKLHRVGHED